MKVNGNTDFKLPEPGTYSAVCTRIIDLGTQETHYQGEIKKARKIMLSWEIDSLMDDGRPFLVSNRFTKSIHPNSLLGQTLETWRGQAFTDEERNGFELDRILGASCMVTLVKDGQYVNVKGVNKIPKGMSALTPVGSLTLLDLENFSPEVYATLSDRIKEAIAKSPEYQKVIGAEATEANYADGKLNTDDIPF